MAILQILKHQFFDSSGNPLSGGKVYTYDAGTSTPRNTYTDQGAGTPNANPVILDSRGEASIWFSGSYKVVLKTSADVTIYTVDNIQDPSTGFVTTTGVETLTNKTLTSPAISSPTITGSPVMADAVITAMGAALKAGSASQAFARKAPAFSVWKGSNQTITTASYTKVTWGTEEFDTDACFASDRFTPSVEGKYALCSEVYWDNATAGITFRVAIYKNGTILKEGIQTSEAGIAKPVVMSIVAANGTTDYFEIFVFHNAGISKDVNGSAIQSTYFSGALVS